MGAGASAPGAPLQSSTAAATAAAASSSSAKPASSHQAHTSAALDEAQRGAGILRQAEALERQGHASAAYKLYLAGLEVVVPAVSQLPGDHPDLAAIKADVGRYLRHAETLKARLGHQQRAPAAAGGAQAAPVDELEAAFERDMLPPSQGVAWDSIVGLAAAKAALQEAVVLPALRPDLYTGLRAPPRGVLLFGPPGTGKTLLARAVAGSAHARLLVVSAASVTSKWMGQGEKQVRALFRAAARNAPCVVFLDEVDALLSTRGDSDSDSAARLKTEFLVQMDGAAGAGGGIMVLAATNRPWALDDAFLRRLPKRIHIPLPGPEQRAALLASLLTGTPHSLSAADFERVAAATPGYSGSDLAALAKEAAMAPLRRLQAAGGVSGLLGASAASVPDVGVADFDEALTVIRASTGQGSAEKLQRWMKEFGSGGGAA